MQTTSSVENRDMAAAFLSPMAGIQSWVTLRMAASSLAMLIEPLYADTASVLGNSRWYQPVSTLIQLADFPNPPKKTDTNNPERNPRDQKGRGGAK